MDVIGVAGFDGVGKTTLRHGLVTQFRDRFPGLQIDGCSISDAIGEYLVSELGYNPSILDRPLTDDARSLFITEGLKVLEAHGNTYWVERTIEKGYQDCVDLLIMDGVRFPHEVSYCDYLIYIDRGDSGDGLGLAETSYGIHQDYLKANADMVLDRFPNLDRKIIRKILEGITV